MNTRRWLVWLALWIPVATGLGWAGRHGLDTAVLVQLAMLAGVAFGVGFTAGIMGEDRADDAS